jgi:hypothetical protein
MDGGRGYIFFSFYVDDANPPRVYSYVIRVIALLFYLYRAESTDKNIIITACANVEDEVEDSLL